MSALTLLGLASMVFVAWFTMRAYRDDRSVGGEQSRRQSIIEAWVNIVVGFSINFVANFALLPLVGTHIGAADNFLLGWCYTVVSIIRQYAVRRWFATRIHLFAARAAERLS